MFELPTQPISIGKILDLSIRNYLRTFNTVLPIILLVMVVACAGVVVQVAFTANPFLAAMLRLILTIPNLYLSIVLLVLMWGSSFETPMTPGEAFVVAGRKFLVMLGFYIMLSLVITVGMILLIIPGIILTVSLVLGQYAVIIEDAGPIEALKRSHSLVWGGNWMKTAAVLTILALIYIAVFAVFGLVSGLLTVIRDPVAFTLTVGLLSGVISALLAPLAISAGLVMFTELKLRKEGADLELAIDNL